VQLWQFLDDVDPATRTFAGRRRILAAALDELVTAGVIQLPGRQSYDRSEHPALPRFVVVPNLDATPPTHRPTVWHPSLAWAAESPATPSHRLVLEKVNRWLFTHRDTLVVPLRERSLEILGDEKALDRLQTTGLFGPGRLTLELLQARRVVPPIHTAVTGDGPILLVVENSDTFDSLVTVLGTNPGRIGLVGWGAGAAFEASVTSVGRLSISELVYFGDLDAKGLQIPANADRLATALGLPSVQPAVGLYSALQQVGKPQPGQPRLGTSTIERLVDWLDPRHRDWAAAVLASGTRVAQEAVGLAHLSRNRDWCSGVV
jgi:hypothetical protein